MPTIHKHRLIPNKKVVLNDNKDGSPMDKPREVHRVFPIKLPIEIINTMINIDTKEKIYLEIMYSFLLTGSE